MRCEYCGGNISLEAEECPYCGAPNKHAQKHAKDMKTYHKAYESTRSGVEEATHKYTGVTVRVVIIAILIVVILVLLVLGAKAYDFRRMWIESRSEKNAVQYMEIMDSYLENEEFIAFTTFCDENYIDTYETVYEKYMPVERASRYYSYVYQEIMSVACPPVYQEQEQALEYLVENLEGFYTSLDMTEYEYYEGVDTEENRNALKAMEEKIQLLLQTYCGLSAEEAEEFPAMTKAQRAILLEEAVANE